METPDQQAENQIRKSYGVLGFVLGLISDIDIESEHIRWLGGKLRSSIYAVLRIASKRHYKMNISYIPTDDPSETSNSSAAVHPLESKLHNHLLPDFDTPVPSKWISTNVDCVQLTALNLSHIANGLMMHKDSKLANGNLWISQIRSSVSRHKLMKLWDLMENGVGLVSDTEVPHETMVVQCKAFRLVPVTKHSEIMTLDGERICYGSIQGQVHPGLGRVFMSGM